MRPTLSVLSLLTACSPELEQAESTGSVLTERVTCQPRMDTFPVADAHNIGYDHASCGSGTCDISCPDSNANSDWGGSHHGIDVFAYQGAPIVAVANGEVVRVGVVSSTSGLRVRLRDACGWEYYYGHLDEAFVSPGDQVQSGDLLGTMGHTGTQSTHLHFNVSPDGQYSSDIDPFPLLNATSPTACAPAPPPVTPPAPAPAPPPPPAAPGCGSVVGTYVFGPNEALSSCDGRFDLVMQGDGNLVLYLEGGVPLWWTGTDGNPGAWAAMQDDGNLVVYNVWGSPLWASGTHGNTGSILAMQDDGNLVIYSAGGNALWHTYTHGY